MNNRLTRFSIAAAIATAGALGLTACGDSDAEQDATTSSTQSTQGEGSGDAAGDNAEESAEFIADLEEGVKIINDQLAEIGTAPQIMLASDVQSPTQKYGMWVMPYYPSEAVEKYMSTVQVEDGKFVVTATSAATGKVWTMDQDGNVAEAAE
ncbi:hypothetical protein [Jonesia quinghaiensis]|uniref:hypothetical protein n=1 Tax=Jonesia quinghaiensis TaxID=262806 RepID=UPI0004258C8B|nr:hypothetical protein [Jonesia quinghaiensis]